MFSRRINIAVANFVIAFLLVVTPLPAKEARPPKWTRDTLDAFFGDAREKLQGERPNYSQKATTSDSDEASASQRADADAATTAASPALPWSQIITAETLEAEIKRLSQSLGKSIGTPSKFKGGGYKDARRDFSELAVLFAVVAEYDAPIRWKDTAAGMRELFARVAANAKVGTDDTYREASLRKDDLAELVRGSRPQVPKADPEVPDWSKVSAREPLMQRLSIAQQERLQPWLADATAFRRNQTDAAHEAQLVALIANVIHRAEYDYWDDETFVGFARELQSAASETSAAAQTDNFEQARRALTRAATACANCHDGYRG